MSLLRSFRKASCGARVWFAFQGRRASARLVGSTIKKKEKAGQLQSHDQVFHMRAVIVFSFSLLQAFSLLSFSYKHFCTSKCWSSLPRRGSIDAQLLQHRPAALSEAR